MGFLNLVDESEPSAPAAGRGSIFTDSADAGRLKMKRPDGQVYTVSKEDSHRNYLINGGFDFAQRQAPGTATTYSNLTGRSYTADRWSITNEAASTTYQRIDAGSANEANLTARFYGRYKRITVAGKLAVAQVIENVDIAPLRGRRVRLQLKQRFSVAASMTTRVALAQLTAPGTADAIPAAFIGAFGGSGVDPTLGANLAYLTPEAGTADGGTIAGAGLTCVLSGAWQRTSAVFAVPATARNLVALVFTNGQMQINDELNLAEVGLYDSPDILDWNPELMTTEVAKVKRYYQKTFALETAPSQNAGLTSGYLKCIIGKAAAVAGAGHWQWRYPVPLRVASVTTTTYNPAAANNQARSLGTTAVDMTVTTPANSTTDSIDVSATGGVGGAIGDPAGVHLTVDAEL